MMNTFQDGKRNSIEKAGLSHREKRSSIDSSPYKQDFVVENQSIQKKVLKEMMTRPRHLAPRLSPLKNLEGIEMARKLRES